MAAIPQTPLSFEQFIQLYGGKSRCEYWGGTVIEKPMGTTFHGVLQILIGKLLLDAGFVPASEVTLRIVSGFYPKPDIIAFRDIAGIDAYPTRAPDLIVEILSEGNSMRYMLDKCQRYTDWGCPEVYVVDLAAHNIYHWVPAQGLHLSQELAGISAVRIWQELAAILNRQQ